VPILEIILVPFALLVVTTPLLTVYLLWRQHKLRQQVRELTERSIERNDALHRELVELRRQMAAVQPADAVAPSHVEAPPRAPSAMPPKAERLAAPAAPFVEPAPEPVRSAAPAAKKPQTVDEKLKPALCAWCGTVHAGGVVYCPKPEASERRSPEKPKEDIPAVRDSSPTTPVTTAASQPIHKTLDEPKPDRAELGTAPLHPRAVSTPAKHVETVVPVQKPETPKEPVRAAPPQSVPPQPEAPHAPPPLPVVPPAPAARVAPPQFAALRTSAPKPTARQGMKSVFAVEELLGKNWLNKIGIVLIVLGVAYFGIKALGQIGPLGRVALSYTVSVALLAGGIFLEKRSRYRVFSYAFIGGGWALLFFTTYALNHVPAMRPMSSETTALVSETTDLILMLVVALAMVANTLRYRSQVVTGMAFLLAYWTVSLSQDNVYSLSSGVILAIGLVSIVIKMGWFELEVFGILSAYLNHLYWLYRLLGAEGAHGQPFPEYHASTALLLFYWVIFRVSYVVRNIKSPAEEHVSTAAALLNTLLLLGVMKFQSVRPELAFVALLVIGAVEFTAGQLPPTKRRREAFIVLTVMGAALMLASIPFHFAGNNVALLWLVGAEALLAAGVGVSEVVFRRLSLLTGLLVGLHLVGIDLTQLVSIRRTSEDIVLAAGVMFGVCAVVFYSNALLVGQRWRNHFVDPPDSQLICIHSYLGGFSAAAVAWALCSDDWTAVTFAAIMLTLAGLGQRVKSFHLQVQFGLLGALTLYRVVMVNLHTEVPPYSHVPMRLFSLPVIAAAFYVTAKWAQLRDDPNQRTFRALFALAGTVLVASLIYFEVPELCRPTAAIVFAVLLLEVGQRVRYSALAWHAHLLTGLAVLAAATADQSGAQRWQNIPLHAFAALPVLAGAYWIAYRISVPNRSHENLGRIAYSWAGTAVMVWVLYEAVPAPWIAVSWMVFAVALALIMRRIAYWQLAWQANAVAAASLVRAYTFNLELDQPFWQGVSLRLITISIVSAGLYFLSRKSTTPDSESRSAVAYLHTLAATALLAFLAWHEAPNGWLAAAWAVFALALVLVDRRFELEDLRWQAHALAALTLARSVSVNLYVADTWHGISIRLLSLAIVAVVFYALSRLIRMPEQWRKREFQHIYSWAASALVSLLLWYELQPLSVAVGWAVFGLVLFEYGLWRKTRQFRFQAYLVLAVSFGRIFFANLTAENPGQFWGPRIYTVLPITLIFFFVYAQLGPDDQIVRDDRGLHFDMLLAYVGTGTVVALLYFQFANEWLVTAWAAVVLVLFATALLLDRPIFLHQALLLTLGACSRGVMHNLFGASYFTGTDWMGRISVLGSAIAVLLACLPFAFRWRDRHRAQPSSSRIGAITRHPEQFMFFAPLLLLTLMLALKMRAGMVTVAWGIEALSILIFAFLINERSFRLTGFLLLLATFAKLLLFDMWLGAWSWRDRYITFFIVGVAMVSASFLYNKYSDKIREFL
jgi:hypothetical protein